MSGSINLDELNCCRSVSQNGRISEPQIPLTRLKMEQLSIFGLPNDYLITERQATALSRSKQRVTRRPGSAPARTGE